MTQDLKDMCFLSKDDVANLMHGIIFETNDAPTMLSWQKAQQAIDQDLSGMTVVPIEPTYRMIKDAEQLRIPTYARVYKTMIAAAPKLEDK